MTNSKSKRQRIYPTMRCRDAEAMIRWLKDVLGFTEYVVYRNDGVVQHARTRLRLLAADARPEPATTNTAGWSATSAAAAPTRSMSPSTIPTRCTPRSRHQAPKSRWNCTTPITAAAISPAGIRKAISGVLAPTGRRRARSRCRGRSLDRPINVPACVRDARPSPRSIAIVGPCRSASRDELDQ